MKYHEYSQAMVVMRGDHCIATARKVTGGWLLSAKTFCWMDKRARTPNVFGHVDPKLIYVTHRNIARSIMQSIEKNGEKR